MSSALARSSAAALTLGVGLGRRRRRQCCCQRRTPALPATTRPCAPDRSPTSKARRNVPRGESRRGAFLYSFLPLPLLHPRSLASLDRQKVCEEQSLARRKREGGGGGGGEGGKGRRREKKDGRRKLATFGLGPMEAATYIPPSLSSLSFFPLVPFARAWPQVRPGARPRWHASLPSFLLFPEPGREVGRWGRRRRQQPPAATSCQSCCRWPSCWGRRWRWPRWGSSGARGSGLAFLAIWHPTSVGRWVSFGLVSMRGWSSYRCTAGILLTEKKALSTRRRCSRRCSRSA